MKRNPNYIHPLTQYPEGAAFFDKQELVEASTKAAIKKLADLKKARRKYAREHRDKLKRGEA